MCKKVICPQCNKPGWAGCGAHVEEVLGDVPVADRCHCNDADAPTAKSGLSGLFRRKG